MFYKDTQHMTFALCWDVVTNKSCPLPLQILLTQTLYRRTRFWVLLLHDWISGSVASWIPVNGEEWNLKPEVFIPGTLKLWAIFEQPRPGFSVNDLKSLQRLQKPHPARTFPRNDSLIHFLGALCSLLAWPHTPVLYWASICPGHWVSKGCSFPTVANTS